MKYIVALLAIAFAIAILNPFGSEPPEETNVQQVARYLKEQHQKEKLCPILNTQNR